MTTFYEVLSGALTLNFALAAVLVACIVGVVYIGVLNYRRYKLNMLIANDLDTVLQPTLEMIKRNEESINKTTINPEISIEDLYKGGFGKNQDIDSPQMLSTMLTVLVHKYGNLRLSLGDFMKVHDEDYISVYVDINSKELILSLDHAMGAKDPLSMVNFSDPDDNTFH
jgi:hypothetical protein